MNHVAASVADSEMAVGQPLRRFLGLSIALVVAYLLVDGLGEEALVDSANLLGPIWLGLLSLWTCFDLVRKSPLEIWTPLPWFLVAVILFYSIGPLAYPLGSDSVQLELYSLIPLDAVELLTTNMLNAIGVTAVVAGVYVFRVKADIGVWRGGALNPRLIAFAMVTLGAVLQYLVIFPAQFGVFEWSVPGVILNLGNLHILGLLLLAYIVEAGDRRWRLALYFLWAIQVFVSILLFNKTQLLLSIILPFLGKYLAHRDVRRLVPALAIAVTAYFSVYGLVLHGRAEIYAKSGDIDQASLSERFDIVLRWWETGDDQLGRREANLGEAGWTRLTYTPFQAYAIRSYDEGHESNTLERIAIVLVPRFFWPDKPDTAGLGRDFYEQLTGRRNTSIGLGIFAEGYWNLGWGGVIGVSMLAGVLFGILGNWVIRWMRARAFEFLPSVVLGIHMALFGTTEFFAAAILGPAGLFGVYALAVALLSDAIRNLSLAPGWRTR